MTKHSCRQYIADPWWTLLTRSRPREIHCGSVMQRILTSAATKHTVWICNKTMTIATTKYTVDLWCKCIQVSRIHYSNRNLGGEVILVWSLEFPGSWTSPNLIHFVSCEWMYLTSNMREIDWVVVIDENHQQSRGEPSIMKMVSRVSKYEQVSRFHSRMMCWGRQEESVEGRPWCILHQSTRNKGRWCGSKLDRHRETGTKDWIMSKL